ncbi:MAG: hypothetical protein K2P45_04510 [Eubacterium sp.]|nr:hypothetical protein [Eubacterium sp.]
MEFMDVVHGVLDVAGFIPVVGAAADVANAAIYAAEGDWGNAALSMVSAVPGVGDVAGAAGKVVKVAAKGASKAKKAGNAVSKTKKMTSFLAKAYGKAKDGAKKIMDKMNRMTQMLKQKLFGKKACAGGKCFTGDMQVYTKNGFRPIKEVRKGDDIYSRNEENGETGLRRIEKIIQTEAHTIYHIWVDGQEKIKTTAYHPFFVKDQGWTNAIHLKEGNLLETNNGEVKITRLVKIRYDEPVKVYNFCVAEWETYFVSGKQVYVHNGSCPDGSGPLDADGCRSMDPQTIRFSQSSVNGSDEITASMKKNGWKGDPIDVVQMPDGAYTTIDNTRVVAAREAGINVKANVHNCGDSLPDEYIERFTTKKGVPKTWGDAIQLRIGKQKSAFRKDNPYGSYTMETIK